MTLSRLFDSNAYFFNPHAVPLFTAAVLIALLAIKVAANRSKVNRDFAIFSVFILVWLTFTAFGYLVRADKDVAKFWFTLDWVGVNYISVAVYSFATRFAAKQKPFLIRFGYVVGSVFSIVALTGNPMMSDVRRFPWGFFPLHDRIWSPFFFTFFFGYMALAFSELIIAYRNAKDSAKRNQIKYLFSALGIAYLGSVDFLATSGIPVYPFGFIAILFFVFITAYAILRHGLMDITIVFRKTLLYSCTSAGLAALYAVIVTLLARALDNQSSSTPHISWQTPHDIAIALQSSFAYFCVVTSLCSVGLGLFVFWRGRKRAIHILWGLTCLAIALWVFGLGRVVYANSFAAAEWWMIHIHYLGALFIPVLFFHFVAFIVGRRFLVFIGAGYCFAAFFEVLSFRGLLIGLRTDVPYFHFYTKPLDGYYSLFVAYFFVFSVFAHILLWHEMTKSTGVRRNQLKWIFWGTSIGFSGGATTFLLVYNIPVFPYGIYLVPIYTATISYAIFKHQLMDIDVVIKKTVLYSLVSAALAAIYVGTITLLAHMLGGRHGSSSTFSSVLAAIFITLLFNPMRNRLQVTIDNKFGRSKWIGHEHLVKLSAEVIGHETLEKIAETVGRILEDALHPRTWALYLRTGDDREFAKVISANATSLPDRMPLANAWSNYFLTTTDAVVTVPHVHSRGDQSLPLQVVVPLMAGRDILGYLMAGEKHSEERYTDEDLVLLRVVANQAAVAFERSKMVQQISGAFVHEIKTPLANISLPAELTIIDINDLELGKKSIDDLLPKFKKRMKYIIDQVALASKKVEAVREVSEPEDSPQTNIDLKEIVDKALDQLAPAIEEAKVRTFMEWPNRLGSVFGRAQQLEIVLINLIKNAVEAMTALPVDFPRTLRLRAHETESDVVVCVDDSGAGIKASDKALLFQSNFSTKGAAGMGVGLFLSRQIIQAHGGSVDVQTQEGSGTTFTIRLPRSGAGHASQGAKP